MTTSKSYLCIEHGEEFIVDADSMEEAHDEAMMWGAQVVCEVKVISRKGNKVEFEKL